MLRRRPRPEDALAVFERVLAVRGLRGDDLTRQFALPDDDEHLQLHCELLFAPADALLALGASHAWWFRDGDVDLAQWGSDLRERREWPVLAEHVPRTVELRLDGT